MHPSPEAVTAPLFTASGFFLPVDKVQVKYEMLRAHAVDGVSATASAAAHGYSRAAFYLVSAAFERAGMNGLLDERPGRRGPLKITPEILAFLAQVPPGVSGADLAGQIADRFGVELHRRTVERPSTLSLTATRFARRGLAGLIVWPTSEPVFSGPVLGGARPRWSPYDDPRMDALAAGFAFLFGADSDRATDAILEELAR